MFTAIDTDLQYTNETAIRGQEICDLITKHIRYLRKVYFGHRPIGVEDIQFPCAMVEPIRSSAEMYTTGKYDVKWTFHIFFYILQEDREALLVQQTAVMEALCTLFSNNALADLGGANSNKYKANPGYWLNSEIRDMNFSSTFAWARDNRPRWARAGMMVLELWDRVIK